LLLGACAQEQADESEAGTEDASSDTGTVDTAPLGIPMRIHRAVDILFVIDNSGSMLTAQQNLAAGIGNLVAVLEESALGPDYRIGITTTDNGNPWCTSSAEHGSLVATSCQEREIDFITEGAIADQLPGGCTRTCAHPTLELLPTESRRDPLLGVGPWFENHLGQTNLGGGIGIVEALGCALPQGMNGCGFEAPLESMWKALVRSTIADDPSYAFMRTEATLAVVFLTDEVDCSYNPRHEEIFSSQGTRVFWSDPEADTPTSAVCWNAGVECVGEAEGEYSVCEATDHDVTGQEPLNSEDAALYPVERYIDLLEEIEFQKKQLQPDAEVLVTVIAGVPLDYPATSIRYPKTAAGASSPDFVSDFGVGPGCISAVTEAVPPVRLAELAHEFRLAPEDNNVFSVCGADYGPVLRSVGESILKTMSPLCMPACVADTEPQTPTLEPSCSLERVAVLDDGSTFDVPVPPCDPGRTVPPGHASCYVPLTRPEEMHPLCVESGVNLEFEIIEVPDPNRPHTLTNVMKAWCVDSKTSEIDCPGLR